MRTEIPRTACLTLKEPPGPWLEPFWEALSAHTPAVEWSPEDPARYYLDAAGMGVRHGDEAAWCRAVLGDLTRVNLNRPDHGAGTGHAGAGHVVPTPRDERPAAVRLSARLGVAGTRFGAQVAALSVPAGPGYRAVAGPDARFLAEHPVEWLPLKDEPLRRLRILGIRTMGALAALPRASVVEQLGIESLTAWRWAAGRDVRPVVGRRCQTFSALHVYDEPETRAAALVEGAARLAERALADLPVARPAWAIRRVAVEVAFVDGGQWSRDVWLGNSPGRETLRALLERLLAALPVGRAVGVPAFAMPAGMRSWDGDPDAGENNGVSEMTVSLLGLEPAPGRQLQLFEAQETDRQWEQIVAALTRRHAAGLVRAEMVDPEAAILTQRYAFRELTP